MARSFIVYQGEDETPEFDLTEPTSDVHVIWEEVEAGGRAFRGESTTNSIPVRDERGETGSPEDLPGGLTHVSLSRGSRYEWLDGPDGSEVRMAVGRIGTKDYSRGRQKADRAREVVMNNGDRNEELKDIIVDDWVRGSETDVARVLALLADYLTGTPRATTTITDTYVAAGNTVTLPERTYDGMSPKEVLDEIASYANKEYFVTIDDELWYDVADSTTYQAGIRISDRPDEIDMETVCESGDTPAVIDSGYDLESSGGNSLAVTVDSGVGALYVAWLTHDAMTNPRAEYKWQTGEDPDEMTKIATIAHSTPSSGENNDNETIHIFRLVNPTPSGPGGGIEVDWDAGNAHGSGLGYWTVDSSAAPTVYTAQGTGTSSSVTPTAGASDLVLDVMGWRIWSLGDASNDPSPTASQTEDWGVPFNNSAGQTDMAWGGGHKVGSGARTWSWTTSTNWVAAAIVIPSEEPNAVATFFPKWDVGPSSTEDGLELISGLRLYFGEDGAYVTADDATTVAEYWRAERSFYTSDPAITDATKAQVLADSILDRLKTENRTYNVSIGPMGVEHVGCIKPGQLLYIKARAIPDADDQFQPRRIAQLKWTTPRPGMFWAHMQLNRPIKELPLGVGPKEASTKVKEHKETGGHPASNITVIDSGTYYTGTDVEAVLQEIGADLAAGPGGGSLPFNVEDYGAVHDGTTDDTAAIQAAIDAAFAAGGGIIYFPRNTDGSEPIYLIDGALQDTGTYNSQLEIPQSSSGLIFLTLKGPATLRSTWDGVISGNPAIISAGTHDSLTLNQVFVTFDDVRIEAPENPKLTAIDMTKAATCRWTRLHIAVDSTPTAIPSNTNAIGLDLPWGLNDQNSGGDELNIGGYYTAIRPSEQMVADAVYAQFCARAVHMRGAQGSPEFLAHSASIQRLNVWFCERGIIATDDLRWLHVGLMDVEHDDPDFETVYDIDDASNLLRGFIRLHTTDYDTGEAVDDPLLNGAAGLSLHLPHGKLWRLADVVEMPELGSDPSSAASGTRRLYAKSDGWYEIDDAGSVSPLGGGIDASQLTALGVVGPILIADDHSTPLVFADLLQTEEGDDLLYADIGD